MKNTTKTYHFSAECPPYALLLRLSEHYANNYSMHLPLLLPVSESEIDDLLRPHIEAIAATIYSPKARRYATPEEARSFFKLYSASELMEAAKAGEAWPIYLGFIDEV